MILLLIVMTFISFSMRALPFLFSEKMHAHPLFEKLALTLPPCILLILVVHSLDLSSFHSFPYGMAEMGGLGSIVFIQAAFRNILASMLTGIAVHQTLLHVL